MLSILPHCFIQCFSSFQSGDTFTSTTEYFSADEGAFSADEFFDLPQDDLEEEVETNNANAAESDKILELFRDVDDKLEGSGEEQEDALRILREHEDEVSKPDPYVINTTSHLSVIIFL